MCTSLNEFNTIDTISIREKFNELPNVTFLSFANVDYKNSMERLTRQASGLPFDNMLLYNEHDLKKIDEFWDRHGTFIEKNKRGYGYWLWKPYLVLRTLRNMKDGDILLYSDSGASINPDIEQFKEMIKRVSTTPSGIVSWELPHFEKTFTKMDLVYHLQAESIIENNIKQLHATFFLLRCSESVKKVVEKWYETASNYQLLDDTASKIQNDASFIEHRHDQSIFSILRRIHGTDIIYYYNDGGILRDTKTRG